VETEALEAVREQFLLEDLNEQCLRGNVEQMKRVRISLKSCVASLVLHCSE